MKFSYPVLLLVIFFTACMRNEQIASKKELNFSVLHFNGNVIVDSTTLPVQGVLTQKDGKIKLAIMAQQGILLGYGWLDISTGEIQTTFFRSPIAKRLIQRTGCALVVLLPVIAQWYTEQENHSLIELPQKWEFKYDKCGFIYHDTYGTIFVPLESIQ